MDGFQLPLEGALHTHTRVGWRCWGIGIAALRLSRCNPELSPVWVISDFYQFLRQIQNFHETSFFFPMVEPKIDKRKEHGLAELHCRRPVETVSIGPRDGLAIGSIDPSNETAAALNVLSSSGPQKGTIRGERNDNVYDDCDESSSSSSDDDKSVLSGPEWREYWPEEAKPRRRRRRRRTQELSALSCARHKWNRYQRQFAKRELLLQRISVGKSRAFVRQVRERERLVQRQVLESLLGEVVVQVCEKDQDAAAIAREIQEALDNLEAAVLASSHRRKRSWSVLVQKGCDFVVFELNSLLPSVMALLVHTVALFSIYDGLDTGMEMVKQYALSLHWLDRQWMDLAFVTFSLALGVVLLRCTGDLYWWLSDPDYDLIKFDFHNRRQLRFWDARILAVVRVRHAVRAVLFLVGYHYCYKSMTHLLFWTLRFFDQSAEILAALPSNVFRNNHGMCLLERNESFCSHSCQREIARRGTLSWYKNRVCF
jgi:hypothetical protein